MSEKLYIEVSDHTIREEDGHELPYKKAIVYFNGEPVTTGLAPNYGPYRSEGTAESSAISRAQADFVINELCDIRGRIEDDGSRVPWVQTLAARITERHTQGRCGSGESPVESV